LRFAEIFSRTLHRLVRKPYREDLPVLENLTQHLMSRKGFLSVAILFAIFLAVFRVSMWFYTKHRLAVMVSEAYKAPAAQAQALPQSTTDSISVFMQSPDINSVRDVSDPENMPCNGTCGIGEQMSRQLAKQREDSAARADAEMTAVPLFRDAAPTDDVTLSTASVADTGNAPPSREDSTDLLAASVDSTTAQGIVFSTETFSFFLIGSAEPAVSTETAAVPAAPAVVELSTPTAVSTEALSSAAAGAPIEQPAQPEFAQPTLAPLAVPAHFWNPQPEMVKQETPAPPPPPNNSYLFLILIRFLSACVGPTAFILLAIKMEKRRSAYCEVFTRLAFITSIAVIATGIKRCLHLDFAEGAAFLVPGAIYLHCIRRYMNARFPFVPGRFLKYLRYLLTRPEKPHIHP